MVLLLLYVSQTREDIKRLKFLHAADLHLDSPLRGLERYEGAPVDEIRSASRRALENLLDLAIEEKVDFVLIAGDVYDGDWKDYNTGLFFVNCMRKLEVADIPVYLLSGNHDAASVITRKLRLPDNVHEFSNKKPTSFSIDALNVAIHGQGFATRAVTENISEAYPQGDPQSFNIGVLHTCLDGKPGHDPYAPCSVEGLRAKDYQYWALGHVHTREVVSNDPYIVFPGNIQGRHVRETGSKGCTLVHVEGGVIQQLEHRALDVMRWVRLALDVSSSSTAEEVYEQLREALLEAQDNADDRSLAVRVILTGRTDAHQLLLAEREQWIQEYRSLATGLGGAGIWIEKVAIRTTPNVSLDELYASNSAIGGLLNSIANIDLEDAAVMADLSNELKPLQLKLPPKLATGDDPYDPTSLDAIKEALSDVRQLLADRLISTRAEP